MAGVFQNIDPLPLTAGECVPPAFGAGGGHTRWLERGVGVNILEDVRHSSVLYVCTSKLHYTWVGGRRAVSCEKRVFYEKGKAERS
jgi:hypothetical protein